MIELSGVISILSCNTLEFCGIVHGCSRECWIVPAGYRRRQAEGGYNHNLAKRERALQGLALS